MFKSISVIISWLPTIVATITAIEHVMGSGNGKEKKEVAVKAIYRVLEKAKVPLTSTLKAILSGVIDVLVAVLNILGVAGFSDHDDQDALDFVPASYAEELVEHVDEDEVAAPAEAAYPDDPDQLREVLRSFSEE